MVSFSSLLHALKTYELKSILFHVFSIPSSDLVIVSFQKCGKTWLRMMLSHVLSKKYDIKDVKLDLQMMTLFRPGVPNILVSHAGSTKDNNKVDFGNIFSKKKIVFLMRDPRDIVVSLFHGSRTRDLVYSGDDISTFIRHSGSGFPKILEFMRTWHNEIMKRPKDFIIVRYEDMKEDSARELSRIFTFMNVDVSEKLLKEAADYASFGNMRKLEMENKVNDYRMRPGNKNDPNSFRTRRGKVGGFRDELLDEDICYINHMMAERMPKEFGYVV